MHELFLDNQCFTFEVHNFDQDNPSDYIVGQQVTVKHHKLGHSEFVCISEQTMPIDAARYFYRSVNKMRQKELTF